MCIPMKKIDFLEYNLDNGLQVILHKDTSVPVVAVSVMYHVGSKNERPDRTGACYHKLLADDPDLGVVRA